MLRGDGTSAFDLDGDGTPDYLQRRNGFPFGLLGGGSQQQGPQPPAQRGGLLGMGAQEQMLLAAALLGGRGNIGANLSQGLMGVHDYRQGETSRQLQGVQLQQAKDAIAQNEQRRQLAKTSFAPGAAPPVAMDDDGNQMPNVGAGGGIPDYAKGLMAMGDIDRAMAIQQAQQKQYVKLGKGESLIDPRNPQRPIASGAPDLPSGMEMGPNGPQYMPAYLSGQRDIRAAGRPQTNVTVAGDKAFTVELAKLDAKQLDEMRDSAMKAQGGLSRIGEMKRLATEGVYSGWTATGRTGVANFFNTIGVPVDAKKLGNSQEYLKHAKELTLTVLKEGVGSNNISNADLTFVNETVPQLETNPQARMNLLNYMERRLGESVGRFQAADSYAREKGGLGGFNYQAPRQEAPKRQSGPLMQNQTALYRARQAIKAGKSREAVIQRLIEEGYDPKGL